MQEILQIGPFDVRSDYPKSKSGPAYQNLKWAALVGLALTLVFGKVVDAQQHTKLPLVARVGVSANSHRSEAFRQGLRELGYAEGKNIVVDNRDAGGKNDQLAALTAEIVRLKPNVIVSAGPVVTRAAKQATAEIPIVMSNDDDPVANRFVASLAQPGGNITGLSTLAPELSGKRLEIVREIVPKLSRVAVLGTSTSPGYVYMSKEIDLAAKAFGLKIQYLDVLDSRGLEPAFRAANKEGAQAILTLSSPFTNGERERGQILALVARNRLPAMYYTNQFVDEGGLMYYGVNILDLDRRSATFVDKILKGAKPTDLPVEQPLKFEFIVNLQAAKKIGLTIPPNVLVRADKVIR
jgi:putative ABC transport system substrate-binding protein